MHQQFQEFMEQGAKSELENSGGKVSQPRNDEGTQLTEAKKRKNKNKKKKGENVKAPIIEDTNQTNDHATSPEVKTNKPASSQPQLPKAAKNNEGTHESERAKQIVAQKGKEEETKHQQSQQKQPKKKKKKTQKQISGPEDANQTAIQNTSTEPNPLIQKTSLEEFLGKLEQDPQNHTITTHQPSPNNHNKTKKNKKNSQKINEMGAQINSRQMATSSKVTQEGKNNGQLRSEMATLEEKKRGDGLNLGWNGDKSECKNDGSEDCQGGERWIDVEGVNNDDGGGCVEEVVKAKKKKNKKRNKRGKGRKDASLVELGEVNDSSEMVDHEQVLWEPVD
mmetsp:Transcript_24484/g.27838  ORF Transcript_24484/g.27838 Transcript_24484/m.27838 type:complete len:336 (+) Transcript_24484:2307-3314(+)